MKQEANQKIVCYRLVGDTANYLYMSR